MGKELKNFLMDNINIGKDNIKEKDYTKPMKITPLSLTKNNYSPFYPKNYKFHKKPETEEFLESAKNLVKINRKEKQRKNSNCMDNDSTGDEMSPEKQNIKKKFHNNINKTKKAPFKGEAKDFQTKYRTELCKFYEAKGVCPFGDKCAYAHGKENLRSKVTNTTAYRTKKCTQFFEKGYCPYGNRCQFAHQLKTNIINNPYDEKMPYTKILEIMSKVENIENIKKLVDKPRLPIFKEMCKESNEKNEKTIESRLFNDIKNICKEGLYTRI